MRLRAAEALGDDLDQVAGTSFDKGMEVHALAKIGRGRGLFICCWAMF
jgi:hypothetical protein